MEHGLPSQLRCWSLRLSAGMAFGLLSCTGVVDPDPVGPMPPGAGGPNAGGAPSAGAAGSPSPGTAGAAGASPVGVAGSPSAGAGGVPEVSAAAPAPASWRRLTVLQYKNTVADLFGTGIAVGQIEPEPTVSGFSTVGAGQVSASRAAVEMYETAAREIASQVVAAPARLARVVSCSPVPASFDEACARSSLASFGRLAFRRALTTSEVDRYVTLWRTVSQKQTFTEGARAVVSAILQSPKFLYRVEYGTGSPTPRRYTAQEIAGRLSYLLWNTTPDAALLDAADKGELSTDEGIRAKATAMLASPRARAGLRDFFAEYLYLQDFGLTPEAARGLDPTLAAAMREQALSDFENLVFDRSAPFTDLLTSTTTHVNATLAQYYGFPVPSGNGMVSVNVPAESPRAGMLTFGAFLVKLGNGQETQPVRRAKFIREMVLCQPVMQPPEEVDTTLPEVNPMAPRTTRQRLEQHLTEDTCKGCHANLDSLGLSYEIFDALGRSRTTELGLPIITAGDLDGQAFEGPRDLAQLLAARPEAKSCAVTRLYRYASGAIEDANDSARLAPVNAAYSASDGKLRDVLLSYIGSSLFTTVSDPQ